jgi:hypothetical protein
MGAEGSCRSEPADKTAVRQSRWTGRNLPFVTTSKLTHVQPGSMPAGEKGFVLGHALHGC